MQSRADLHLHGKHRDRPSEWFPRRMGAPESFVEPLDLYGACTAWGMDFVTITDHSSIDGALRIAHMLAPSFPPKVGAGTASARVAGDPCEARARCLSRPSLKQLNGLSRRRMLPAAGQPAFTRGPVLDQSSSDALTVIAVGLGGRGRQWLQLLSKCDDVKVVCGVDPDPGGRYEAARYLGGPVLRLFPTLDIALGSYSAQAAIVCTPVSLHEELSLACLEAGMGVLLEKPFAGSARAAHTMTQRAKELDLPLIVAQNYRYAMPALAVGAILGGGLIGEPGFAQCVSHMCRRNPVSPCMHLSYAQLDMAVHHFDTLRYVLEAECTSVRAKAFNTPWSFFDHGAGIEALLTFDSGAEASYVGSWASRANRFSLRVEGADGFLTCEDKRVRYMAAGHILPGKAPAVHMHPLDRLKAPFGGMHALIDELRAALAGDRSTPNRAEANLGTLGIALACALSDQEGREVSVSEALSPDNDLSLWERVTSAGGAVR